MKLLMHIYYLSVAFVTILFSLLCILALVLGVISFILWSIAPIPSTGAILMTLRVLIAASTLITIAYSFSSDYNQAILELLSR